MTNNEQIKVWDPVVRIFHWMLVAGFAISYLTSEESTWWHVNSGYLVFGLVLFRLVWGFAGTAHARFSDFVYRPGIVLDYIRDIVKFRARRYVGHNPAGGFMIVLLLLFLILTGLSGMMLYGADDGAGPFAGIMSGMAHDSEEVLEDLHEFFANGTVVLVFIHVAGVIFESLLHKENLVRSMWNGYKRAE